jgi:hypothetical protein
MGRELARVGRGERGPILLEYETHEVSVPKVGRLVRAQGDFTLASLAIGDQGFPFPDAHHVEGADS